MQQAFFDANQPANTISEMGLRFTCRFVWPPPPAKNELRWSCSHGTFAIVQSDPATGIVACSFFCRRF